MPLWTLLLLPLLLAACGAQEESAVATDMAQEGAAAPPVASMEPSAARAGAFQAAPESREASGTAPSPTDTVTPAPARIIRTGSSRVQVERLEEGVQAAEVLAKRAGGYVAASSIHFGERQERLATLTLKIPAENWEVATGGLQTLGRVLTINVSTEDVGEEFTDLESRLRTLRRLEERLLDLLANRTGRLEDLLMVERELARVRGEMEQLQGRLRYLSARVRTSTLTLELVEPQSMLANPDPDGQPIRDALRHAWANFIGFISAFIASLGVLIPLSILLLLGLWLGYHAMRFLRRHYPRR